MTLSILVTISEVTTLCFICLAASIGNVSLFLIVYKNPNLRTITNMFILNLAAADILVSMLSMPVTIVTIVNGCWVFGHTACVVLGYFTILSFIASVMSLGMIAINRYFYIVKWNTYTITFAKTKALLYAAGVWFVSMFLASPPLFGWAEYRFIPGKSYCFVYWPSSVYFMYFMITVCFFGPLSVMAFSYYNILNFTKNMRIKVSRNNLTPKPRQLETQGANEPQLAPCMVKLDSYENVHLKIEVQNYDNPDVIEVCNNSNSGEDGCSVNEAEVLETMENKSPLTRFNSHPSVQSKSQKPRLTPEEQQMTNTFLLVFALFIICWAPFAITMFFDVYYPQPLPRPIDTISLLLGYLNSMCNPVLYGIRNSALKQGFVNLYSWLIPERFRHRYSGHKVGPQMKTNPRSQDAEETSWHIESVKTWRYFLWTIYELYHREEKCIVFIDFVAPRWSTTASLLYFGLGFQIISCRSKRRLFVTFISQHSQRNFPNKFRNWHSNF